MQRHLLFFFLLFFFPAQVRESSTSIPVPAYFIQAWVLCLSVNTLIRRVHRNVIRNAEGFDESSPLYGLALLHMPLRPTMPPLVALWVSAYKRRVLLRACYMRT